jgi:hypothetical protein
VCLSVIAASAPNIHARKVGLPAPLPACPLACI